MKNKEHSDSIIAELVNELVNVTFEWKYPVGICLPKVFKINKKKHCAANRGDCILCRFSVIANYRKKLLDKYLKKNNG